MAYQPIESYGLIGDMRTAALVSTSGWIDWLCFPNFDSPSIFAAILDDEIGGRFEITPRAAELRSKQLYFPDTNVLVTRFFVESGVAEVVDFMPVGPKAERYDRRCVVRHVRSIRGKVALRMRCAPAFEFARSTHQAEVAEGGVWFRSPSLDLALGCDVPVRIEAGIASAEFSVSEGVFRFRRTRSGEHRFALPVRSATRASHGDDRLLAPVAVEMHISRPMARDRVPLGSCEALDV